MDGRCEGGSEIIISARLLRNDDKLPVFNGVKLVSNMGRIALWLDLLAGTISCGSRAG